MLSVSAAIEHREAGKVADRVSVGTAFMVGAPASDAAQAEGMLAAEQPKLALCSGGLLQHMLHAHTALHCLAVPQAGQPVVPRLALTHVLLTCLLVVRMQHVPPTNLHTTGGSRNKTDCCALVGNCLGKPRTALT